jgi:hypothetical protein
LYAVAPDIEAAGETIASIAQRTRKKSKRKQSTRRARWFRSLVVSAAQDKSGLDHVRPIAGRILIKSAASLGKS